MDARPLPAKLTPQDRVLLFDGVCNVCNASVQFILKHDPRGAVRFASLQSEVGQEILKWCDLPTSDFDTLVFFEEGRAHLRSSGALRIAGHLGWPWKIAKLALVLPAPLRDLGYRLIAHNRYRWFGKKDECMIPTPDIRARFLDWGAPPA